MQGSAVSPIVALSMRADEMKRSGKDIINLTLGEPSFELADFVKDRLVQALYGMNMGYTQPGGIAELRSAIRDRFYADSGLEIADDQISVGCGAQQVLLNVLLASTNVNDEVIVIAPYWPAYLGIVKLARCRAKVISHDESQPEERLLMDISSSITTRTKWILLNSPRNPDGYIYSVEFLKVLSQIVNNHRNLSVAIDQVYDRTLVCQKSAQLLHSYEIDMNRVVVINSVSKTYSMPGWRVGWGIGPRNVIAGVNAVQSEACTQTATISQIGAAAAMSGSQAPFAEQMLEYSRRRNLGGSILQSSPFFDLQIPPAGIFLFPKLRTEKLAELTSAASEDGTIDCIAMADYVLAETGVAVSPGRVFGKPGYVRLSMTADTKLIGEACERVVQAIAKYNEALWRF